MDQYHHTDILHRRHLNYAAIKQSGIHNAANYLKMVFHRLLLSFFVVSVALVAESAALAIDEKDFTPINALRELVHRVGSVGLRLPGSDTHNGLVHWVNTSLHAIPGLGVQGSKYSLASWEPKKGMNLSQAGSLCINSDEKCQNVPIIGAIPFTLPTNGSAITGPLIYVPSNQSISSVDVRGKVILRDFLPLKIPFPYILKDSFVSSLSP